MKLRIELSIQKPARKVGIRSGADLHRLAGLKSLNQAYDLWNERSTRLDLKTIARLCEVFRCDISTILIKRKDKAK